MLVSACHLYLKAILWTWYIHQVKTPCTRKIWLGVCRHPHLWYLLYHLLIILACFAPVVSIILVHSFPYIFHSVSCIVWTSLIFHFFNLSGNSGSFLFFHIIFVTTQLNSNITSTNLNGSTMPSPPPGLSDQQSLAKYSNRLGLSWPKLKFSLVRVADEVEVDIKVGVSYEPKWVGLGVRVLKYAKLMLIQVCDNVNVLHRPNRMIGWIIFQFNCKCSLHPTHPTTETQQQPSWASDYHFLTITNHHVTCNNKQDHNNNIQNYNNKKNNNSKKIISL